MNNRFKTVNLSYLEEISGGDILFQKELIRIFMNQIPEFISNMQEFLLKNENRNLAKEAHTAKSSVLIFMMDKTGKDLKQIQVLAEKNETAQIPQHLKLVEKALNSALTELNRYMTRLEEFSNIKPDHISMG